MGKRVEWAYYQTATTGYERWHDAISKKTVAVHQLVAIANGAEPWKVFSNNDYDCHHKNGIKWDNRPENIEVISRKKHTQVHIERGERPQNTPGVSKETLRQLHVDEGKSYKEIAKIVGLSVERVRYWVKEYGLRWDQRWKRE